MSGRSFTREFGRVRGVDASADAVAQAEADRVAQGIDTLTYAVDDAYALASEDGSWDVVHAHQVLQHLTRPIDALREFRRVLAPDGVVAVRGWETSSGVTALELGRRARQAGLERAVYTNVVHDGTLAGPDVEGGRRLQEETGLRVTLSGGVGTLEHVRAAARAGLHACIVGRALLEGRFTLAQALEEAACSPGA